MGNSHVVVKRIETGEIIADRCKVARSFSLRAKGLLGTRSLEPGQGLLLDPCNNIHMWFMSTAIDAVFLRKRKDRNFDVVGVYKRLKPWKLMPVGIWNSHCTLELPSGTADRHLIQIGDVLCID